MLIQNDFRRQFYEEIKKQHVLLIVNTDVDALCAAAILTHIFSCDEVTYSLIPVDCFDGLKEALQIHGKQVKNVIIINCIGSNSIVEMDLESTIWIIESQRPIHLDNIYNADSIKVIVQNSELASNDWQIPDAEQIYEHDESSDEGDEYEEEEEADFDETMQDDESEGEEEEEIEDEEENATEDGLNGNGKRPKSRGLAVPKKGKRSRKRQELANIIGRRALKRQEKAQWKRNRGTLLWEYYMKSWYAAPVSVFLLELAHELGKSNAEMTWCAAVGISSQYMDHLVSLEKYTEVCADRMGPFIRKFGPRAGIPVEQTRNLLRISFNKELILPLYTHWSLYESMSNESMFICQGKMWSQRGEEKFKEILAQLGLTLAECNQNFEALKKDRRKEVFEILLKHLDTGFASFKSHLGYNSSYNAVDFARIIGLQLEYRQPKKPGIRSSELASTELARRFEKANGILRDFFKTGGREMHASLGHMIEQYKLALRILNELVKRSIVQKHVIMRSRYFLLTISEQCPILGYFSSRHFLFHFAHSMLRAHATQAKSSSRTKPFVLAVPMNDEGDQNEGWYLVTGLMPLTELVADTSRKSILGSAFKHVAKEANIQIRQCLDSNVVMVKAIDRLRFFNILDARLESA